MGLFIGAASSRQKDGGTKGAAAAAVSANEYKQDDNIIPYWCRACKIRQQEIAGIAQEVLLEYGAGYAIIASSKGRQKTP
ncbi:MAG: hypothetical protein HFH26_07270 [Clostridiaceae bacterium]|nr:hypothetical protein [Clostridiaceae bacterium]